MSCFISCPPMRAPRITRSPIPSTLEDGGDAHAAGGADRDQSAPRLVFIQDFRERGHDARAGRGERMADGETAALHIEPGSIDAAEGARQSELVAAEHRIGPGFQSAQNLSRERLMYLVEIEVRQPKL